MRHFWFNLEENLLQLHRELWSKTYRHSPYKDFWVRDPKLRHIHKACVRDRVVHQAIFRVLYQIFDRHFIFDSYSCRFSMGPHKTAARLATFCRKVSGNWRKNIFALKCDIQKFFANIDHQILLGLLKSKIYDEDTRGLIETIIGSFGKISGKGLPLGNATSQLFANVYLNEMDQFIKHVLKQKYYSRYCDDLVILGASEEFLETLTSKIDEFLKNKLKLSLHPDKVIIRWLSQGIDFAGYVILPHHILLRARTRERAMRKLLEQQYKMAQGQTSTKTLRCSLNSYLGLLKHCNGYKIRKKLIAIAKGKR